MASRQTANIKKIQSKQQRQEKQLDHYKREARWVTWAAIIILLLIIFFVGSMGYASNWWQNPTRTSQFSPYAADTPQEQASNATETTSNGGDSGGSSTTTRPSTSSTSTTNSTTNNTTTTTTTNLSSPKPSNGLLTLIAQTATGENINDVINQAKELGVTYNCRTELLVQVCEFSDGPFTFTTKNLVTNLGITGISTNF